MRQTTSHLLWLSTLPSLWAGGHCSPLALPEPQSDGQLSYNPGGPMVAATTSIPMTINPGGVMLPTDTPMSVNPGGPMVPETPASEPAPTPMSVQPGGPLKPPRRRDEDSGPALDSAGLALQAQGRHCTWTVSEAVPYPCSWNGIETIYPATATSTKYADCHGCLDIQIDKQIWYCPAQIVSATAVVHTPKTTWTTACAQATVPGLVSLRTAKPGITSQPPAPTIRPTLNVNELEKRSPQGKLMENEPAACPTTYVVQPGQSAGSTSTRYQQTVTSTVRLNCGGCPLVLSTALAGYGPAGRFTTTVTRPVGTTTAYLCQ